MDDLMLKNVIRQHVRANCLVACTMKRNCEGGIEHGEFKPFKTNDVRGFTCGGSMRMDCDRVCNSILSLFKSESDRMADYYARQEETLRSKIAEKNADVKSAKREAAKARLVTKENGVKNDLAARKNKWAKKDIIEELSRMEREKMSAKEMKESNPSWLARIRNVVTPSSPPSSEEIKADGGSIAQ